MLSLKLVERRSMNRLWLEQNEFSCREHCPGELRPSPVRSAYIDDRCGLDADLAKETQPCRHRARLRRRRRAGCRVAHEAAGALQGAPKRAKEPMRLRVASQPARI